MSLGIRKLGRLDFQAVTEVEGICLRLVAAVDAWVERARQRRALLEMSDHMLKDLGIGRAEAYEEAAKPFWRN